MSKVSLQNHSICDDDVNLEPDSLICDRCCTTFYVQLLIHFDFHDDDVLHISGDARAYGTLNRITHFDYQDDAIRGGVTNANGTRSRD